MKIGAIPENLIERIALWLRLVPTPLVDTGHAMWLARTVMVATKLGVFETLANRPLTADQVAERCGTHPAATRKLLTLLVALGYVRCKREAYTLAPVARRWLLKERADSLYDGMLFRFVEWKWAEHLEAFLETGQALHIHDQMSSKEWECYARGLAEAAQSLSPEVADRTLVPAGARDLLDVGGSHGHYAAAICRRHPNLRATILDLPEAVERAAPLLAQADMGDRVTLRAGNALTEDLGTETFDVIFMSQLIQFFDDATSAELIRRMARMLRPGSCLVIQEVIWQSAPEQVKQQTAFGDLYYALINEGGARSFEQYACWQADAGLQPQKSFRFISAPMIGQQAALKMGVGT